MVAFKYIWRLVRCTFVQTPLRFSVPASPSDLSQKVFLVTGGSAGIGLETVRELAKRNATVIVGSRSVVKAEAAVQSLESQSGQKLKIQIIPLDLADLASVKSFVQKVQAFLDGRKLDVLINNAGIMVDEFQTSKQGHEIHFATNHLGHFLLTQLLLPNLASPGGRVVFVNAELHTLSTEATPDFKYKSGNNASQVPYCRSKLAGIWYAYELQRRYPQLIAPVLHPGVIATQMNLPRAKFLQYLMKKIFISTAEGAQTSLYCALAQDVKGLTYYNNVLGVVPSSEISYDKSKAAAMWELSDRLTKQYQ